MSPGRQKSRVADAETICLTCGLLGLLALFGLSCWHCYRLFQMAPFVIIPPTSIGA